VKLSNSPAKAGPMSVANALGLTRVPRLELGHFESQPDSPRINQRLLRLKNSGCRVHLSERSVQYRIFAET
jgi:hypothetical protein